MRAIFPLLAAILIAEVTTEPIRTSIRDDIKRARQGSLREYLPPSNTQRPRPFQPQTQIPTGSEQVFTGYPYPGSSPNPPFSEIPIFTTPEPRPIPSERPEENGIFPGTGYPSASTEYTSRPQTGFPSPSTGYPSPSTGYPSPSTGYPSPSTGYPSPSTGYPSPSTGYPSPSTGYPSPSTGYPSPSTGYPSPSTGYPSPSTGYPSPSTSYPGPSTGFPGLSTGYPSPSTGYPTTSQSTTGYVYTNPTTRYPLGPSTSTSGYPSSISTVTGYPGSSTGYSTTTRRPYQPGDNEGGDSENNGNISNPDDDDKHPPHIHAIDVQCAKDMMTINVEFNRVYNGIIYSKGFYNNPECRYVNENSNQIKYTFTVSLNSCGTEFVNAFDTQGKSYLENVLVLQNEASIQEVWDTIRSVRCLWEGNLNKALSVALSVGMLTQEIVTFSGDTAMAKLDIQLGRGPFAQNANGLVKIGETMTLVVSVMGDPGFDIQVKDCRARDSNNQISVGLTDEDGCVIKPKIFGAFQKTRNTGNTGASIIAYAYFSAFKFPDVMDLILECNIELCKTDCEVCPDPNQKTDPGKRRRRDLNAMNDTLGDPVTIGKLLRVILPEEISDNALILSEHREGVCLSTQAFVFSSSVLISLLTFSCLFSAYLWLKLHRNYK